MRKFSGLVISKLSLIHIATLCALAVSHPLYDILTKEDHATFFIAHQLKAIDIYIFVLALSVFLPLVVFAFLSLLNLFSKRIASGLYAAVLSILFTLLFFLVFENLNTGVNDLDLFIPIAAGLVTTLVFVFMHWAQWAISFMFLAVILSPIMFLSDTSIRTFLSSSEAQDYSLVSNDQEQPNVVRIIFDEFPLTSLLDENRLIDDVRYPNFASLAKNSHWFRNTSTTHYSTRGGALPSILTGWYPDTYRENSPEKHVDSNSPIQTQNMPKSIFTLLQPTHKIFAIESISKLAPTNQSLENKGPGIRDRLVSLTCDASVVYSHHVVPQRFRKSIPTIHGQWGDFCTLKNTELPHTVEWPYSGGKRISNVKKFIESFDKNITSAFYFFTHSSLTSHFSTT